MTYIRGDAAQFDAWEKLGNNGWNWDMIYSYMKKVEHFTKPEAWQIEAGASYNPHYHGTSGDLKTGFSPNLTKGDTFFNFKSTWKKLGQLFNQDPNGGSVQGYDIWPQTLDPVTNKRSDSATSFYWPVQSRKNLHIIKGTASHLTWKDTKAKDPVASGVEYYTADQKKVSVKAKKEVIISAGSYRTPLILERSGVGNPKILSKLGIDVVVNNPGVGENLIDQVNVAIFINGTKSITGISTYDTFVTAKELYGSEFSVVAKSSKASLKDWAKQVAGLSNGALSADALAKIFSIQHDVIFNNPTTVAEIITTTLGQEMATVSWETLPFWRGSVHLKSTSVSDLNKPAIDPKYFSTDFDTKMQTAISKLARNFWTVSPASKMVGNAIAPTEDQLPSNATDAEWRAYMAASMGSNQHPLGTASMMSRELGGVVSPELKVWGTSNVRVVDASVIPMQMSGHLTATIYALAEKGAEMIIQSHS